MIGKRLFVILMILVLVFVPVRNCYAAAEAATLTVVGGSVAAGGIAATAVALAPVALVIAGVALAAQGIYVFLNDDSIEEGKTNLDFIGERLQEFCAESGRSYGDFCRTLAEGSSVSTDGKIVLTNAASNAISQWINSLVADDEIIVSTTSDYVMFDGVALPYYTPSDEFHSFATNNGSDYSICVNDNNIQEYVLLATNYSGHTRLSIVYKGSRYCFMIVNRGNQKIFNGSLFGNTTGTQDVYYLTIGQPYIPDFASDNMLVPFIQDFEKKVNNINWTFDTVTAGGLTSDCLTSDDLSTINPSDFTVGQNMVNVIDPGMDLEAIGQSYGKSGTITIDNYLQSLQRALNGVQDNTIAINDALTGVIDNVNVGVYNPSADAVVSQEDEDTAYAGVYTPAIDVSLNPSGTAAEDALKGLQFDLTHIFPFCIPFDLYALVEKFDVTPVTPNVHLVIPLGGISEDLVLDLDFAPFETVAQVLRTMELIAFVVGLAMVTRHIIRG